MKRPVLATAVATLGLFLALGGTAAANGGSGSATFCSTTAPNVIGGAIPINLEMSDVDPSQKGYATCGYAGRIVRKVTALELTEPRVVAGFECTTSVLQLKDLIRRYVCRFRAADTATKIDVRFRVRYVPKQK